MAKYNEKISDSSIWITATPSPAAMSLPFYITESGFFSAEREYIVERSEHDSYLLLFTSGGRGEIITGENSFMIEKNQAAVINCRKYHKYHSAGSEWNFFWIHFNGASAETLFSLLYNSREYGIALTDPELFRSQAEILLANAASPDISANIAVSAAIHELFAMLIGSAVSSERGSRRNAHEDDIAAAVEYIKAHYSLSITVDDIISGLHISKYHFIRLFSRIMGVTPYSYLTSYRINISKKLLRTTEMSVAEISEKCGFTDTSNFISQFKKRTGQKPTQYRRDFS